MSRSYSCIALCLRVKPSGESNREAWFLNAEEGIFRATVFGGPKSKLRSLVAPFHEGMIWIYRDPVKDSRKITDFDVNAWRPGLREMYERSMAADAIAGTILATHAGGGNWDKALEMARDSLDCMEKADERTYKRVLLHFLWVWSGFLGFGLELKSCSVCACDVPFDGILWYDLKEGNLICKDCRSLKSPDKEITLGPGARRWLMTVGEKGFSQAQKFTLDNASFGQARVFVLNILGEVLGKQLLLWDILEH